MSVCDTDDQENYFSSSTFYGPESLVRDNTMDIAFVIAIMHELARVKKTTVDVSFSLDQVEHASNGHVPSNEDL